VESQLAKQEGWSACPVYSEVIEMSGWRRQNFKKSQEISRYFKRFSNKFRKSLPALTLFSRPLTTT